MNDFIEHIEMDGGLAVTTWDDAAPIIGFQVDAFNWRLRRAREAKGWSRAELARQIGVTPGAVGDAEKLRRVSANVRERMALALGVPEDVLFPGEIDALPKGGPPQIELSMTREDVRSAMAPDAHADMILETERAALRDEIEAALDTLQPRQRRIVRLRFGFEDGAPRTTNELAHEFGVTPERIRQIEAAALRLLCHPSRSRQLRVFEAPYAALPVRPPRDRCQKLMQEGRTCLEAFPPPGWMEQRPPERKPLFWCYACWKTHLLGQPEMAYGGCPDATHTVG